MDALDLAGVAVPVELHLYRDESGCGQPGEEGLPVVQSDAWGQRGPKPLLLQYVRREILMLQHVVLLTGSGAERARRPEPSGAASPLPEKRQRQFGPSLARTIAASSTGTNNRVWYRMISVKQPCALYQGKRAAS